MSIAVTALEYFAGLIFIKGMHRKFARENQIDLRIEELKEHLIRKKETLKIRVSFMLPLRATGQNLVDDIRDYVRDYIIK